MIRKRDDGTWLFHKVDQVYQWHHDQVNHSVQNSLYKAMDYLELMTDFIQQ